MSQVDSAVARLKGLVETDPLARRAGQVFVFAYAALVLTYVTAVPLAVMLRDSHVLDPWYVALAWTIKSMAGVVLSPNLPAFVPILVAAMPAFVSAVCFEQRAKLQDQNANGAELRSRSMLGNVVVFIFLVALLAGFVEFVLSVSVEGYTGDAVRAFSEAGWPKVKSVHALAANSIILYLGAFFGRKQ